MESIMEFIGSGIFFTSKDLLGKIQVLACKLTRNTGSRSRREIRAELNI